MIYSMVLQTPLFLLLLLISISPSLTSPNLPIPSPLSPLSPLPSSHHPGHTQTQGAIAVLIKYIAMLHEHTTQVLPLASHVASFSIKHFSLVAKVVQEGPTGALLPELAVGLVLLQLRMPLQMAESDCAPLVGELVEHLDRSASAG